ncbi:MAG: hypothetical protein KAI47_04450 [Deltaproteobacteria bacterium]|nr:hypothetical protein [Deltaproteobacteria bacterium]
MSTRIIILFLPLGLATAALITAGASLASKGKVLQRLAGAAALFAFAFSLVVTPTRDLRAIAGILTDKDRIVTKVANKTPMSFAIIGWPQDVDHVLALRNRRDIEYADLFEAPDDASIRRLLSHWFKAGRPVFAFTPRGRPQPPWWQSLHPRVVDSSLGLYRLFSPGEESSPTSLRQFPDKPQKPARP